MPNNVKQNQYIAIIFLAICQWHKQGLLARYFYSNILMSIKIINKFYDLNIYYYFRHDSLIGIVEQIKNVACNNNFKCTIFFFHNYPFCHSRLLWRFSRKECNVVTVYCIQIWFLSYNAAVGVAQHNYVLTCCAICQLITNFNILIQNHKYIIYFYVTYWVESLDAVYTTAFGRQLGIVVRSLAGLVYSNKKSLCVKTPDEW